MPRDVHALDATRGGPRLPPVLATVLALAVAGAAPTTIVESFGAAVARLKTPSVAPGVSASQARVGLDTYRSEADALAKGYGPAAAGFLRTRARGPDPDAAHLALMTLAVLANETKAATELAGCLRDSGYRDSAALMALTYVPAQVALALADEVLARRDPQPEALAAASTLFRFFGDARRASALEADLARRSLRDSKAREEASDNLVALRQRLARPSEEHSAWSAQDLIVWRAIRSMPGTRSLDVDLWRQAAAACARTRFTPAYLKDRLGASSIGLLELRLLLQIAGIQREAAVIPELTRFVETRQGPWGDSMHALLSIGTRDALAPVERLITPPKAPTDRGVNGEMSPERLEADQRGQLVLSLCQDLARRGDRVTFHLMESLATNAAYPSHERAAFAQARNALRARLGAGP
jgi:hypothetical protein